MHPFIDYILKANLLLIFFGLFYLIFLKRETFYQLNRWYFLGSIIVSITAPLITFTKTVLVEPIPVEIFVNDYESSVNNVVVEEPLFLETIDLQQIIVYLVLFISLTLIIRKIYAVVKLYRTIKKMPSLGDSNIKITAVHNTVYSFYRWIVVPENFFQWQNHKLILNHENIHLKQKHTVDLVLIELVAAFLWFNPMVKVMQRAINTNLEFIVDQKMIETTESVLYQKNLLQFQTQNNIQFVNSYNASEIKNRILQLNSKKSTHMRKLKLVLTLPILIGFFTMFQIETVAQVKETIEVQETEETKEHKLIEKKSKQKKEEISQHTLTENQQDFFMLLDTVEKDVDVLKYDRKTFDIVASKFPIEVDGLLMTENELKNFDTARIKSVHIDAGTPEKGTIVKLSTTNGDGDRMFTFKLAEDNDQTVHHLDEDTKSSFIETEKPYNKIMIDGKEATEEELQKFYRTAKNFKARNENKVIIVETNFVETNRDQPHTTVKIGNNTLKHIYLLNGKEISGEDFRKIHPDDIERIDVLKDKKSIEKYGDKAKGGVLLITTKAKKDVSLQQKKQALKDREVALKKRNEAIAERKEIVKERKKKIEEQRIFRTKSKETVTVSTKDSDKKQLNQDYEMLNGIFNDVRKIKDIEDENLIIMSASASITREDGSKVKISEVY